MIFLLDTNVVSELRKAKPHGAVISWYSHYPPASFALPSVTLYELQAGAELTRRQDPGKAAQIDRWIDALVEETTILSLDGRSARQAARLMDRQSRALIEDAMVAAIAEVHGLTVATRNTRDFERFEVPLVNPFTFNKT